uniref:ABC-type xenobiotic transporter n=1 Tax=Panagrellus redivivus TaxID=6233 RepID=A0A7E4VVU9_PANRE
MAIAITSGPLRYATKTDYAAIITGIIALSITVTVNPFASQTNGDFKTALQDNMTTNERKVEIVHPYVGLTWAYCAIMLIGSYVGLMSFAFFCDRQITQYSQHYLAAVLRKNVAYFDSNLPAAMAYKLDAIDPGIAEKLGYFFYVALLLLVSVIVAFMRNWTMAICGNLLTGVFLITYLVYRFYTRPINAKRNKIAEKLQNLVSDVFSGIFTVITSANQEYELKKYDQLVDQHTAYGRKAKMGLAAFMGFNSFSSGTAIFVVYYIGAVIYYATGKDYAQLWTVSWLVMSALVFTWSVAPYFPVLLNSLRAIEDILRIIDEPLPRSKSRSFSSKLDGQISFQNVDFAYPSRPTIPVLTDVSMDIPFGSKVAFVGESGSGKSTAALLLTGLRSPVNGEISIDGIPLKSLNSTVLRSMIGFVPQEPTFFTASVSDNLKLGLKISDEVIRSACETAYALDFIEKLPSKFDTIIGAGGIRLSGGQRQHLAIARALVRNPKILILDEATSALDAESEAIVSKALMAASKGRTIITIAHRLATVRSADVIFVFENGAIVERGCHEALVKLDGVYAEIVKAQKAGDAVESCEMDLTKRALKEDSEEFECVTESEITHMTSLKQLLELSGRQSWILLLGLIITGLTGATTSPFISLIQSFYSAMDDPESEGLSKARILILKALALNVASGFCVGFGGYLLCIYGLKIGAKLQKFGYSNILHQDGYFFDKTAHTHGNLAKIISEDPNHFDAAFDAGLVLVVGDLMTFIGSGITAGFKNWQLALTCWMILIVLMVGAGAVAIWVTGQDRKHAKLSATAAKILSEGIQNIDTIHLYNAEHYFLQSYMKVHKETSKIIWKRNLVNGIASSFGITLPMCMPLVVLALGVQFLKAGVISPTLVSTVADAISPRVTFQIMAYFPVYARSRVALTNLYNIATHSISMTVKPELPEGYQKHVSGEIAFKNITFSYPNRPNFNVLNDFNLHIPPGTTVALVGTSGCGKSTIIQLIARMYRPISGTVTLDGHTLAGYRQSIAIVGQEPALFNLTVADNIAYGKPGHTSMESIRKAAIAANIDDFIKTLPQGYDTLLGARGTQLSGGQRQRIAIARALVRNPKVLILDEATSALDAANETKVQEALKAASKGRTCIIVAHRLSTVRDADCILVLEGGQIVESGTHDELIANGEAYKRLISNQ